MTSTAPIYFEPVDPPDLPIIPVDRETFESVVAHHHLAIEIDNAAGVQCVELDGAVFAAPLEQVTT